jgi:hypothetical protein
VVFLATPQPLVRCTAEHDYRAARADPRQAVTLL